VRVGVGGVPGAVDLKFLHRSHVRSPPGALATCIHITSDGRLATKSPGDETVLIGHPGPESSDMGRASLAGLTVVVCFAPAPCPAQEKESRALGPEVMPQPFDRGPFRAVRVPEWVQDTVGVGYTLSGMDAAARARAVKHGVTITELGFVDPFYPY